MAKMKSLTFNNVRYDVVDADSITSPDTANVGQTIVVKSVDKNNKPIEWKAVDFPQGGGGGGTGGGSSEVSWNDIIDKPFGEKINDVEVLPLTQFDNFYEDCGGYGLYGTMHSCEYDISVGETYIVTWDGIEYECVAQDMSFVDDGAMALGNASAFGMEGNDEPFLIGYTGGMVLYGSITDTEEDILHSVRIAQERTIVQKLDPKYLPDNIGGSSLPEVTTSDAGKFLRVNSDGAWVAESIPSAEGVSF